MTGDRGSATVVAAAMVVLLLSITGAAAYLGSAVVGRHRAQAAADLAAVAAAGRLPAGVRAACTQAVLVADQMAADHVDCVVDGLDVVVTVEVAIGLPGTLAGAPARAAARAGPWR